MLTSQRGRSTAEHLQTKLLRRVSLFASFAKNATILCMSVSLLQKRNQKKEQNLSRRLESVSDVSHMGIDPKTASKEVFVTSASKSIQLVSMEIIQ